VFAVVVNDFWLYSISTFLTEVKICWWVVHACPKVYFSFMSADHCCQVFSGPTQNITFFIWLCPCSLSTEIYFLSGFTLLQQLIFPSVRGLNKITKKKVNIRLCQGPSAFHVKCSTVAFISKVACDPFFPKNTYNPYLQPCKLYNL